MDQKSVSDEIKSAMRARDKPRLSVLRLVKNEIDSQEKETGAELSDAEVVAVVKKVRKQTAETLEGSVKAGTDPDRTALLQTQVAILDDYLPEQVTGEALERLVDRVIAEGGYSQKREMGAVIAAVAGETGGSCDKAEVARVAGARLT